MGRGEGERVDGWTGEGGRAADPADMNSDSGLILRLVKCLPPQSTAQLASLADFLCGSLCFLHFFPTAEPGLRLVRKKDKSSFVPLSSICIACVAWRFWLLSNKGGRGQKNRAPLVRPARQNRHATQATICSEGKQMYEKV